MRAVLRFLIQVGVIILAIWLLVKYTSLDDKVITFFRTNSSVPAVSQSGSVTTIDPSICETPWGLKIPDGSSIYAYATENNTCKEELRTCKEGILDGSYPYGSCATNSDTNISNPDNNNVQVAQGASCTTPWGETLNDGGYIIAYESRNSCRFEKRYCEDGMLNGSFSSNTCYSPTGVGQSPVAVVTPNVTTVSYGYVQGNATNNTDYDGPARTSTNGKTTVIYSWNDTKTNPTSRSANDSQYIEPVNYRNYDLTQHGCTTPWGSHLDHGSWTIAYRSPTPATAGASCVYERRTCFQGTLGGSYAYSTCSLGNKNNIINNNGQDYFIPTSTSYGKSCVTAWGETVRDGDYVLAYKSSYTSKGNACQGEYRYCKGGVLQGSYNNRSCSMAQDQYRCSLPRGGTIPHGSSVVGYNSPVSCASQIRTCNYGRLSGTYTYSYCNSKQNNSQRSCYLPWGGSIPHGAAVLTYGSPYGNCSDSQRRTCYDGVLNGSYQYSTCNNNNNNYNPTWNYGYGCLYGNCGNYNGTSNNRCQLPRGGSISHGSSIMAYSSSNGPCYSQTRTCNNGYLNGSYQYGSCSNNNNCNGGNCGGNNGNNKSCTTPWGQVIGHGSKIEAYQNSSAPCYKQTRTCSNGYLDGSFQYGSCNPSGSNGSDTYGSWQNAGTLEGNVDSNDSCNNNATSAFSCGSESSNSCTDYARVSCSSFSPLICSYQKRSVSCVR